MPKTRMNFWEFLQKYKEMDFSWPKEYLTYKASVIDFAEKELNEDIIARDEQGTFSRDLWKKCANFGIQGLVIPKAFGGQLEKVDFLRAIIAMEGLGFGCQDNGLALGLNAQMWTVQLPISLFGNDEQREKFVRPMTEGAKIGVHALTEPNAGSDIYSMETTAKKVEGGYLITGKKHLITLAPEADFVFLFANLNPKLGKWGITAFIVEKDMPGFTIGPVKSKMGMRTVPIGELEFKDCFVPEENRLGKEGTGFGIMADSLEYDRCGILSSQVGRMERQLKDTIDFARNRQQFGRSIGKFQSVSNRIADMKLRLEMAKLLLYKVGWLKNSGKSAMLEASMLKLHISESFIASSLDSIRTHGGIGYLTDTGIERDLRDAVGGVLYAGTSDIQRNVIAKLMGL